MIDSLAILIMHFSYVGLFVILVLCGLGLPLPEEAVMVMGGYLVYKGITNLWITMVVGIAGAIIGDMLIFQLGRKWGEAAFMQPQLRRIFSKQGLERTEEYFKTHGDKTLFFARFISGFRAAAFLISGVLKMRTSRFLLIDFVAAAIYVPLFVYLGYYFGKDMDTALKLTGKIHSLMLIVVPFMVLGIAIYFIRRRRKT
jgi:membrane protein DedA with SNARE-associated domain